MYNRGVYHAAQGQVQKKKTGKKHHGKNINRDLPVSDSAGTDTEAGKFGFVDSVAMPESSDGYDHNQKK